MALPVVSSFARRDLVPTPSVTLRLPDALYQRLNRRAEQAQRALEDELLDMIAAAVLVDDELPKELSEALSSLVLLDDEALWGAARTRLPAEAAEELEGLHLKRQREGISASEAEQAAALLRRYERVMLVRAQAAALLRQRGHDVSVLLTVP
jgi:plasmid stability protein